MSTYDVIVIGSGPGGYVAAARAGQLGLKTAIIEKESIGGTCVNWGCIPTKVLLKNAESIDLLSQGKVFGFQCDINTINYSVAYKRSRQVAKKQGKRIEILLKQRNVSLYLAEARLINPHEVELSTGERLKGKYIILATGSRPRVLPGLEFDNEKVISYREALNLMDAPASIIIVGAGPIGMEFATLWNRYGSKVTVLELMSYVLPNEDEEISLEAKNQFQKAGIKIKTGVKVETIQKLSQGIEVVISSPEGQETLLAEKVLLATGFIPNSGNLGLEKLGIALERGYVAIDSQMATNIPNIYAIGDLTGKLGLAHVASAQGIIAAEAIAGNKTKPLIYEHIPSCIFGHLEVASVGLTEKQAKEQGYEIKAIKSPFAPNGKALALNENFGFIKIIANAKDGKLLGVHMIGSQVTEIIATAVGLIALEATVEQIKDMVFAHPTLSEAFLEGIHALAGHAVHL